jgi:hypothetical protein
LNSRLREVKQPLQEHTARPGRCLATPASQRSGGPSGDFTRQVLSLSDGKTQAGLIQGTPAIVATHAQILPVSPSTPEVVPPAWWQTRSWIARTRQDLQLRTAGDRRGSPRLPVQALPAVCRCVCLTHEWGVGCHCPALQPTGSRPAVRTSWSAAARGSRPGACRGLVGCGDPRKQGSEILTCLSLQAPGLPQYRTSAGSPANQSPTSPVSNQGFSPGSSPQVRVPSCVLSRVALSVLVPAPCHLTALAIRAEPASRAPPGATGSLSLLCRLCRAPPGVVRVPRTNP